MKTNKMTIAVLGGGNGAFATAAHLALEGFRVNMYEVPELEENIAPVRERGGIEFKHRDIPGLPSGFARLNVVSTDPSKVLADAEVVWLVIPSFGQKRFAETCAPYLKPEQIIVLTPGNFGGAIEFASVLKDKGLKELPKLVEAECMIYFALKDSPAGIFVGGFKRGMAVAAFPGTDTPKVLPRLRECYPTLVGVGSVLETALRNGNLVVHAPIMLLNTGRVESKEGFVFYHEGCTPSVGKIVEAVDRERVAVGKGLGLRLPTEYDVDVKWYGYQGAGGKNLTELLSTNPAYTGRPAPRTMNHRFLTEDIPYGMVPVESLGVKVSVPTPIISSLINIANEMLGVDLRKEARDLKKLGLDGLSIEQLKEYVGQWEGEPEAYY